MKKPLELDSMKKDSLESRQGFEYWPAEEIKF